MDYYTLTLFNAKGVQVAAIEQLTEENALNLAEEKRPVHGASYITCEGTVLQFKPYRSAWPKTHRYPSTRRMTAKAIRAKAAQFARAGDHSNSHALLDLLQEN